MTKLTLQMVLLSMLGFLVGGCSHGKPKSSAHLYEGESPSIRYTDRPEAAGGAVNPY